METFVSAIVCEACGEDADRSNSGAGGNYMLPVDPLDHYSPWICIDCDFRWDDSDDYYRQAFF